MKNIKYFLALIFAVVVFISCDSDVTVDDSKAETEDVTTKTGDQGNEEEGRDD